MVKRQTGEQTGAVSIFAVIFSAMLLTILTVGFIKLMISDQQQASSNDLSQSAYDSAIAGVEDAKRLIKLAHEGDETAQDALSNHSSDCRVIALGGIGGSPSATETVIRTNSSAENSFDQAYTCVKINMLTNDYLYESNEGRGQIIPLKSNGDFNKIVIEWFTEDDLSLGATISEPPADLPPKASWGENTPPLIRVQLITPGTGFSIDSLDSANASQTTFLKPESIVGGAVAGSAISMTPDVKSRATAGETINNSFEPIICSSGLEANGGYSCRVELKLSSDSGMYSSRVITAEASNTAFLRLNTIYRDANVRVQLMNNSDVVSFNGVQPAVDSTGRASSLFRRVEARLRMGDDFPYPDGSVDIMNSLCKNFAVTDTSAYAPPVDSDDGCRP